ncbi:MAG TPA: hypothetical protein ENO29_09130 [Candidatus Aminicenantes bacterium]|nr:hypothetical protein [Candidatus Aminicenantes bacterium]
MAFGKNYLLFYVIFRPSLMESIKLRKKMLTVLTSLFFIMVIGLAQSFASPQEKALTWLSNTNQPGMFSYLFKYLPWQPGDYKNRVEPVVQEVKNFSAIEKLNQFLLKKIGREKLNDLAENYQAMAGYKAFDLYLLNFWIQGKTLEALALIDLKLKSSPEDPLLLEKAGTFSDALSQYELAYEFLKEANQHFPDNPVILNNLGVAAYGLNHEAEAKEFFLKAITLAPLEPEANYSLYLINSRYASLEKVRPYLKNSLEGSYREELAAKAGTSVIPAAFKQEVPLPLPPLPTDYLTYQNLTSFYQNAILKLEEKEAEFKKRVELIAFSRSKTEEPESQSIPTWRLKSTEAYSRLLELGGRLDRLERESEQPVDLELEKIISQAIARLEAIYNDYAKKEKACLEVPPPERPECLKKARENYCRLYMEQADYYYHRYRSSLEDYFHQAELEIRNFLNNFYFWVRYLPEQESARQRAEAELRVLTLYRRWWEKALLLLTRIEPPAFPECLPNSSPQSSEESEPAITFMDPVSEINLTYQDENLSFSLSPDHLSLKVNFPEIDFLNEKIFLPSTIYLLLPEGSNSQVFYLTFDGKGQLNDLGKVRFWTPNSLNSDNYWKIFISLGLPPENKNPLAF